MRPIFLIIWLVFLASCFNQGDCVITATNLVKIALLKSQDGTKKLTSFREILEVDSLETRKIPFDTLSPTDLLVLPLNPNMNRTTFVLTTSDTLIYHITLDYKNYSRIISTDCGAFYYYNQLSVKDSDFDSTKMISRELYISVTKNLEVFF